MKTWEQRGKEFDDWCAFAGKATHQGGLLFLIFLGVTVTVVTITAVSVLGVIDLLHRLTK